MSIEALTFVFHSVAGPHLMGDLEKNKFMCVFCKPGRCLARSQIRFVARSISASRRGGRVQSAKVAEPVVSASCGGSFRDQKLQPRIGLEDRYAARGPIVLGENALDAEIAASSTKLLAAAAHLDRAESLAVCGQMNSGPEWRAYRPRRGRGLGRS